MASPSKRPPVPLNTQYDLEDPEELQKMLEKITTTQTPPQWLDSYGNPNQYHPAYSPNPAYDEKRQRDFYYAINKGLIPPSNSMVDHIANLRAASGLDPRPAPPFSPSDLNLILKKRTQSKRK